MSGPHLTYCPRCDGAGCTETHYPAVDGKFYVHRVRCEGCDGSGYVPSWLLARVRHEGDR